MGLCTQPNKTPSGGLNLYGYADGDPINFSDPFALMACPEDEDDRCWDTVALLQQIAEASGDEGKMFADAAATLAEWQGGKVQ